MTLYELTRLVAPSLATGIERTSQILIIERVEDQIRWVQTTRSFRLSVVDLSGLPSTDLI